VAGGPHQGLVPPTLHLVAQHLNGVAADVWHCKENAENLLVSRFECRSIGFRVISLGPINTSTNKVYK